jgi:hypothetical protein
MTRLRPALGVLLMAALAVGGCGGASSGGAPSTAASVSTATSGPSGSPSASGGGSAAQFCATFQDASQRFGSDNTFPTKSQTDQARKFASDLEASAPPEMQQAARGLAAYFRAVADGVDKHGSNPSPNPATLAAFAAAIAEINTWAQTNCKQ